MPSFGIVGCCVEKTAAIPPNKRMESIKEIAEKAMSPTKVASDIFKKSFI
jgi:hypothetical protein